MFFRAKSSQEAKHIQPDYHWWIDSPPEGIIYLQLNSPEATEDPCHPALHSGWCASDCKGGEPPSAEC